jgi:uncharacterized membrane protein
MSNPLRFRMAIAILALVAGLVALYLHLWKLGLVGSIACTAGRGCEVAMTSPWSWFLGVDVALIGALGYGAILGVALWGAQPDRAWSPRPTLVLLALIVPAVLFTIRLKWAEWVVLALLDLRRVRQPGPSMTTSPPPASAPRRAR